MKKSVLAIMAIFICAFALGGLSTQSAPATINDYTLPPEPPEPPLDCWEEGPNGFMINTCLEAPHVDPTPDPTPTPTPTPEPEDEGDDQEGQGEDDGMGNPNDANPNLDPDTGFGEDGPIDLAGAQGGCSLNLAAASGNSLWLLGMAFSIFGAVRLRRLK